MNESADAGADGVPGEAAPGDEVPENGVPGDGVPEDDVRGDEVPEGTATWRIWLRRLTLAVGCAFVAGALLGVLAHYSPFVSNWGARIAAFTPVLLLGGLVGFVLVATASLVPGRRVRGRWWFTAAAAVVVVAGAVTQAPILAGSQDPGRADLRIMQANVFKGRADVAALAATVRAENIDVLTLSELTGDALTRIEDSSIAADLPYSATFPAEGGSGIGLYSRYPLSDAEWLRGFRLGNIRAEMRVPGRGDFAVYAVHPAPPWPEPAWRWNVELERLGERFAAEELPVLVGGDFNSTYDHEALRRLLSASDGGPGMTDAAERTGAGWVMTYPANTMLPALIAIDRVLTRGGPEPVSFHRVDLPGSDHYGVVAGIDLG